MKLTDEEKTLLRKRLNLSERQAQVVENLLQGVEDTREIARRLGIAPATVKTVLHAIYMKTRTSSRLELALAALEELGRLEPR